MTRVTTIITKLIALAIIVSACGVEKKAKKSFEGGAFQSSIDLYNKILTKKPNNPDINFFMAESYRQSNRTQQSLDYYKKAIEGGVDNDSILVHYASALKANGQYSEAKQQLGTFLKLAESGKVTDKKFTYQAQEAFDNIDKLEEVQKKKNYYRVKNLTTINTEGIEYSPIYNDGELYFTTSHKSKKIFEGTGTPYTDIYKVKTSGAKVQMSSMETLGDVINTDDAHEASITFSPDGKTIVFARSTNGKRKGIAEVSLFTSRLRNGNWTPPRMLGPSVNVPGTWTSTPAFSRDGKTLYFSSNRKREGTNTTDLDIYSAKRNSRGRFFKVKNLGPEINTFGNDLFPYVSDDGHLYFSSDGHPGFGGLDLFRAQRKNGRTEIENLGNPINSGGDDFGFFLFKPDRGFFTSNREDGKGDDDIYTFVNEDPDLKIVNYYLEGVTMTHDNNGGLKVLPNVEVQLLDYKGEVLDETTTEQDGKFLFRVYEHEHYNLLGDKKRGEDQYLITREEFTTVGKSIDRDTLKQLVTEVRFDTVLVLEKIAINTLFVLENIYYDLNESYIREDAEIELDKLVTILKDNPELKIELSSHTDDRQTDEYNQKLSQRRATAAVNYIISQGIDQSRLEAKGYGESKLKVVNAKTEEEHQVNRRTEFKILEIGTKKNSGEEFNEDRFFGEDDGEDSNER